MALGAARLNTKFPTLQNDLTFKLFQKFSFDAFFAMRTAFGHFVNFWKDTNKPFGLSVVNTRVFFNIESSFVAFRRMFLFLTEAFESYRRFSIFFVSGLPAYDDFKSFFVFHKKTMPLLGHGFMIHWLGGLLTNLHCVLRNFFRNSEAALLKYKKQIKRDWFTSVQSGLRQLRQFPDIICFFSISGVYEVAVKEAKVLRIPTIAFVDSNCEVSDITFPIPGNDDSMTGLEFKILLFREFLLRTIKNRLFSEINSLLVQNYDLRQEVFNQHMEMLVSDLVVDRKFTFLQKNHQIALAGLNAFVDRSRKISVDLKTYFSVLSKLFFQKIANFKVLVDSFFYRAGTSVGSKFDKKSFVQRLKRSIAIKDWKKLRSGRRGKRLFFCAITKNIRYKVRTSFVALRLRELFFVNQNLFKFAYFFYIFIQFFFRKSFSFSFDRFFFILLLKNQLRSEVLFYFYKVLVLKNTFLRFFFKYRSYVFLDCCDEVCGKKKEFTFFNKCLVDFYGRCSSTIFIFRYPKLKFKPKRIVKYKIFDFGVRFFRSKFIPKLISEIKVNSNAKSYSSDFGTKFKLPFEEKAIPSQKPKQKSVCNIISKKKGLRKQKRKCKIEKGRKKLTFGSVRNFLRVKQPVDILQLKSFVHSKLIKLKRQNSINLAMKLQCKYFRKFKFLRFGSGFRQYPFLSSFFFRRRRRRFRWFNRNWKFRHKFFHKIGSKKRFKFRNFRNFNDSQHRNKLRNTYNPKFKNNFGNKFRVQYIRPRFNQRWRGNQKKKKSRRVRLKFKFVLRKELRFSRPRIRMSVPPVKRYMSKGYRRYRLRKLRKLRKLRESEERKLEGRFCKLRPRYSFERKFFKVFFVKKFLSKFFPVVKRKKGGGLLQRSSLLFKFMRRLGKRFLKLRRKFVLFYRLRKRKLVFNKIKLLVYRFLLRFRFWKLIRNNWLIERYNLGRFVDQRIASLSIFKKLVFRLLFTGFIVKKLVMLSLFEVNFFFFYGFFKRKTLKVNFLFLFFTRLFYYFRFLYFRDTGFWKILKIRIIPQFRMVFMLLGNVLTLNSMAFKRMFKIGMRGNLVSIFFRNLKACVFPAFVNKVFFRNYCFKRFHVFMKFRNHYLKFLNSSQLSLIKLKKIFDRKFSHKFKKNYSKRLLKFGFLYYKYFSVLQLRAKVFSKKKLFQKRYCLSLLPPLEKRVILPEKKSYLNFFLFMSKRRQARVSFFFKFRKKYIKSLKMKRSLYQFNALRVF